MSVRRDNLRRLVEHLLAAEQLAERAGLSESLRVFPVPQLRDVAKQHLAAGEDTKRIEPPPPPGPPPSLPHLADAIGQVKGEADRGPALCPVCMDLDSSCEMPEGAQLCKEHLAKHGAESEGRS